MIDAWQHILKSLEPEIEKLKYVMENGPMIKTKLSQNKNAAWQITIYQENLNLDIQDLYSKFSDRIEWTAEEIEKWNAWRNDYNTWIFDSKDEAEKFLTFYTLKWSAA